MPDRFELMPQGELVAEIRRLRKEIEALNIVSALVDAILAIPAPSHLRRE